MKYTHSPVLFFIAALGLFIVDIAAYALFEQQILYGVLALFCLQVTQPMAFTRLSFLGILLSLESFLYYSRFGLQLVFLIPLGIVGILAQGILYKKGFLATALLLIALLIQSLVIEYSFLGLPLSLSYTFSKVFVTLSMLWIISLTYK